ncbi:MAG: hypothetical protein WC515_06165 [Candidatus Omnitrophota bacterium]
MKRAAFLIAAVYGLILIALTQPVAIFSFWGTQIDSVEMFRQPVYWIWILVMMTGQLALLVIPTRVAGGRPVSRRSLIWPIAASGLMMGILAAGLIFALYELAFHGSPSGKEQFVILSELVLVWALWALVFRRWSNREEPGPLVRKLSRTVYRGSILELLVAVPSHLIARQRTYCCAGADTFVAIAFGLSVMLFSFGPGIFFLYADRIKGLKPK